MAAFTGFTTPPVSTIGASQPGSSPANGLFGSLGAWASSPQGQTALQALMNGTANYAQNQQNQQNFQQQLSQNLGIAQGQLGTQAGTSILNDANQRANALAAQAPTGWAQQYEQQQELRNIALQKLMNPVSTLPDALAQKLGVNATPFKPTLPADWASVNPFGVSDTMQALGQRQGVLDNLSGGQAPAIDFTQLGIDPNQAATLNDQGNAYRQYAANNYNNLTSNLQNATNLSRNPSATGGGQGGPGKGASALSGAATGAGYGTMVMPGIGTAIGAGIGALAGLFKGGSSGNNSTTGGASPIPWQQPAVNPYSQMNLGGNGGINFSSGGFNNPQQGGMTPRPYMQGNANYPNSQPTTGQGMNEFGAQGPSVNNNALGQMPSINDILNRYRQGSPLGSAIQRQSPAYLMGGG